MEILQFLLSFFLNEYGDGKYKDVFNLLKENSFDLKKVIKNIKPETATPILKELFNFSGAKKPPENFRAEGLTPIMNIADEKIISTLNGYFYE